MSNDGAGETELDMQIVGVVQDAKYSEVKQVGIMSLIGGAIGILAALGLGRAAQSLMFGLEGNDPLVIAIVTLLLGGVALGAGYIPALKASRVDPMRALRYE